MLCLHLPSLLFKSEREIRKENKKEEATASEDLNLNFSSLLFHTLNTYSLLVRKFGAFLVNRSTSSIMRGPTFILLLINLLKR